MEKQNAVIKQFERIVFRWLSSANKLPSSSAITADLYGMCLREQENIERIDKNFSKVKPQWALNDSEAKMALYLRKLNGSFMFLNIFC